VFETIRENWQSEWRSPLFRKKLIAGAVLVTVILSFFPLFFQYIEKRNGTLLHDVVLQYLPAFNVSTPIFIVIWAISIFALFRALQDPPILMHFLWAYALLCVARMASIFFIPLEPPLNLLPLVDPISNAFYGRVFITKDLFFSGHTATVFLIFLCLKKKTDRALALIATCVVGILLMVQHVHYTVDVLMAPLFTAIIDYIARKIFNV